MFKNEQTYTENTNTENTNTKITNTSHHQKDNIYNNIYNINNIVSDDEVEIIDEDFNSNEIVECKNDIDKNNLSLDSQVDYVFELWQKKAKQFGFASIYKFTASRKNMMKNRIKDYTLDGVLKALEIACSSDFLCGKVNGYKMDWEFFCRPNKISEIHEGKYSNRYKAQSFNAKNKNSMEQDLDVLRDWRNEKEMTANGF